MTGYHLRRFNGKEDRMIRGTKIKEILLKGEVGAEVTVNGWIRQNRSGKDIAFFELNDGSIIHNLQIVLDKSVANFDELIKLGLGACIRVHGRLTESPGKEQHVELKADEIFVFGNSEEAYPLQKKRHSFEFLRTIAHLRPRTNTYGAVFRIQSAASFAIHNFFQKRNFYYIHTPIITSSDCEGAGEMFNVTTLPLDSIPLIKSETGNPVPDYSRDFFKVRTGLTVSGQLEGETFAMALSDIYTFGPTFRAENSNTPPPCR
jgi:asparaginyl-tRNA synthetase